MDANSASAQVDRDVATIGRITAVPSILRLLRLITGMEAVAIARVTTERWTACAILDDGSLGVSPGGQLELRSTLCNEVTRQAEPIAVDDATLDTAYGQHEFFRRYPFRSYIAEPIILAGGESFGTLCAMGRQPTRVSDEKTLALFRHFADQIASEIDSRRQVESATGQLDQERAGGVLRERFIAVLGHDLRNPLSSISAAANVLNIRRTEPEIVSALADRVLKNVRRMAGMIDDLFDLTRGRMGSGVQISRQPIADLATALEDVVEELRIAHAGRKLISDIDIAVPIRGDEVRLQQLVSNLVGNAITHGAGDSPIVISASVADSNLRISVRNEGRPIPPESIPGIFDAFSRRQPTIGRSEGLGLGLYICEQIVRAHGGQLTVTSTELGGTVFLAVMPV